ncbi:hypothetical protein JTB14_005607 [Gonioctena quinquepunctata]|nr:hypothetical protein JTB14_005607 [Gonioctena quinquepunctata]
MDIILKYEEAFNLMDDDNLKELIPKMEKRLKFKEFTEYLLSREKIQCYPVDVDVSNTLNDHPIVPELERQRLETHLLFDKVRVEQICLMKLSFIIFAFLPVAMKLG